jgi:VIT1/CCC1 family predicted Fe2+/Mn2+ transporter
MSNNYRTQRRPILGFFSGLLFGLGVAVLLFSYAKIALGTLTPYVIIGLCTLLGVLWSVVGPARGRARG